MGADVIINRHEKDPVKEILALTGGRGRRGHIGAGGILAPGD